MSRLFEHFQFANPLWLLLLLLVPFLWFLAGRLGAPSSVVFPSLSILGTLSRKPKRLAGGLALSLLPLGLAALALALARPQWTKTYTSRKASGIDIVVALDVSYSMEIPDFIVKRRRTRRIDIAKSVTASFIEQRTNDRIGMIAFAGRPYQVSPITLDHSWLVTNLEKVQLGEIDEQGTAIGSAIAASASRLQKRDSKSRIVVLVTDGANNSGKLDPIEAAKLAKELDIRIYTIAIGTENGRVTRQQFPQQEFDVTSLQEIAKITGAEFYRARDTESLQETFATINELEKTEVETSKVVNITELYSYFALAGFLLSAASIVRFALNPPPTP